MPRGARRAARVEERLRRVSGAIARLKRLRQRQPLAYARPWHNPLPKTSQRRALRHVLDPANREVAVFGGNRSGKTELMAMVAALYLLGPRHPAVIRFMKAVDLPLEWIPYKPGGLRVCMVSLTFSESVRVQRTKLERWLGDSGAKWRFKTERKECEVSLSHDGGGYGIFKANEQGARKMQADAFDFVWLDEEPDEDVYKELLMRTVDTAGKTCLSMTPLRGKTFVYRRFVDESAYRDAIAAQADLVVKGKTLGCVATWIHGTDNPHVPQDFLAALLSDFGEHERAARARGEFVALQGRVYPSFKRSLHVVDPFDVPHDWPRYQAWDFGVSNPTSIHDYVLNPETDEVFVVWERYVSGVAIEEHAQAVLAHETCTPCNGYGYTLDTAARDTLGRRERVEWDKLVRVKCSNTNVTLAEELEAGLATFRPELVSPFRYLAERHGSECELCTGAHGHAGRSHPPPRWRVADPAGASERKTLQRFGLRTVAAKKGPSSIRDGISACASRLAPGSRGRPRFFVFRGAAPRFVDEIESYVWDERPASKTDDPDLPRKKNDHAMDEWRYFVSKLDRRNRSADIATTVDEAEADALRADRDRDRRTEDRLRGGDWGKGRRGSLA